jgi:hypothetical protein
MRSSAWWRGRCSCGSPRWERALRTPADESTVPSWTSRTRTWSSTGSCAPGCWSSTTRPSRSPHEALIGAWPRLRGWLTDDRQALRVHRQLTEAAAVWESLGRDDGSLYRGSRLAPARELAERGDARTVLTAAERSFLDASIAAERAERAAARHRARQLSALTAALALLLVLALGAATVAARQWGNAVGQRQQALSRQLASEAVALGPTDVEEAMRRGLAGWRAAPTVEARGALLSLASRPPYTGRLPHAGMVKDVAFNADGTPCPRR